MAGLVVGNAFAFCNLDVTISVRCGACPVMVAAVDHLQHLSGQAVEWGMLPVDWHVVDGQPYCPAHRVQLADAPQVSDTEKA